MAETVPFSGFSKEAVAFLSDLRANNNRDWFNANKTIYEREIKHPAEVFASAIAGALETLTTRPHRHKTFRIHRDIRFSKDKTPYNTHVHIAFMPKQGVASPPAWFFGLDPETLTLGAGIFGFEKADLDGFRQRVLGADGDRLADIMQSLEGEGIRLGEPHLKRVPSGYPQDHPRAELLRYKGFSAWIDHADPMIVTGADLVDVCMGDFERLKPVYDWLSI